MAADSPFDVDQTTIRHRVQVQVQCRDHQIRRMMNNLPFVNKALSPGVHLKTKDNHR